MNVLEQTCRAHHFELQARRLHREGKIPGPLYLSLGQEHVPAAVAAGIGEAFRAWPVFAQHRRHHWALAKGAEPVGMFRELLGLPGGCDGGWGGSASMTAGVLMPYAGFIGEQAPVAVGWALATGKPCVCVLGDAACEEDYVLGALGHAATHDAPVLFVVEDNDRSILTPKADRRCWDVCEVADSLGLHAWEDAWSDGRDEPDRIVSGVQFLLRAGLPGLLSVRICRHCWHEGSGSDGAPRWDRCAMMLAESGDEGKRLDEAARAEMEEAVKIALGEHRLAKTDVSPIWRGFADYLLDCTE